MEEETFSSLQVKSFSYQEVKISWIIFFFLDGNTVISPVGNKISMFDLKNHR